MNYTRVVLGSQPEPWYLSASSGVNSRRFGVSPYPDGVPTPPRSVAELLALLTTDPGRPRLTWYSGAGERVELSGAVLDNWVSKTANLLVEEFDAAPGTRVLLDLPAHWRSVVWALAAWRVGACVVTSARDVAAVDGGRAAEPSHGPGPAADVVVTDRPSAHRAARDLVVVSLAALARRFDGALPAGAVDAASAVMTYSDRIGWSPAVDPAAPALATPAGTTSHAALFSDAAGAAAGATAAERVLLEGADLPGALREVLTVLAGAASVVLLDGAMATALRADAPRRTALVASERVTSDLL